MGNERKKRPSPSFLSQHKSSNSGSPTAINSEVSVTNKSQSQSLINSLCSELGISLDAYSRLQQAVYWAEPDRSITNVSMSTSPAHTTFIIENLKESYQIGEELFVTVHAKDFDNKSKSYGGDFFQAKLFWSKTKVSDYKHYFTRTTNLLCINYVPGWVRERELY